ncbi:hypothetical protein J3R83DRAFT_256 [Lanmaoa asiatica]|nr:hypothetical protein J3R83DRAFT_256 [Lanmaoa asiatica]
MSPTPVTPATKHAKTPRTSVRKRRREVADEEMADSDSATTRANDVVIPSLVGIHDEQVKLHFGEDKTWYGTYPFASIATLEGRKSAQRFLYVWLVFATSFEHGTQFGPKNAYNTRVPALVGDFVVEQCGVRPEQIERFPSGGKTTRYLLTLDKGELDRVIWKFPRGWVKLARGLGCRFICPLDLFPASLPVTISHVPAALQLTRVKQEIERLSFVRSAMGLQRAVLENNVRTDKVEALLEVEDGDEVPISARKEQFTLELWVDGFRLVLTRRPTCVTCGDDDHVNAVCQVRQKLGSQLIKGWSYVDQSEGVANPQNEPTEAMASSNDAPGQTTAVVDDEMVEETAEPQPEKKKSSKKRKGKGGGNDSGPPAKKAKK